MATSVANCNTWGTTYVRRLFDVIGLVHLENWYVVKLSNFE